ncbi:uncharacterized protein K489DRAFT_372888 [Dissoconium aciculare CBS 342.82]|uniref:Uncharacterized protein n=1 Tax=Dissoconium aciculare CBS 342.82 TaxID=1314786 RepID=A0A6J3LXB2_9PEZI|nr:uncharacterized protein K489DRAFT_372888 [Dissoconium aciculare CBS 342.82]KAF1820391.1 hypothetical protein K489DRAFT_372888 [Dissoconium aciculare CBS 342.82]
MSIDINDGLPGPFIDSNDEDGNPDVSVDADDYAETAAGDVPSDANSRTYQSEEAFQREMAGYVAKVDDGNMLAALIKAVPCLAVDELSSHHVENGEGTRNGECKDANHPARNLEDDMNGEGRLMKIKLSKREIQLLGYTAGELYFLKEFSKLRSLCRVVSAECEVDTKLQSSLKKWEERCQRRVEQAI